MSDQQSEPEIDLLVQWCLAGTDRSFVILGAPLDEVIEHFRAHPETRILPVVDADDLVVGGVFEEDVRRLLFNPFGHALLQNPRYGRRTDMLVRPCPMVESNVALADIVTLYADASMHEGMIVTRGGRLIGVLSNAQLMRMAAAQEVEHARTQAVRLDRMTVAGARFERDAGTLADLLGRIADDILGAADAAATRATRSTERVATVAETAERTDRGIELLAGQARALSETLGQLRGQTVDARETAVHAVTVADRATVRTTQLVTAVRSIESMLALIQSVAKKVNLLALNATIEAARAGEAGRGFAVVAGEVKALAGQTRLAAGEIEGQVVSILLAVDDVASGQAAIRDVMATVDALTHSVDASVTAQRNVTDHVAESAEAARDAAQAVSAIFNEVEGEVRLSLDGTNQMQRMAQDLTHNSARLRLAVGAFVGELHAA